MRTFTPNLAADLARTDGSGPVWLLRFTAAGTDYILCQDAINIPPWGKAALPWIASWGQLTEGVTSTLSDFNISSLSVNMINDPNATPNLRSLAKARALNGLAVSVYLWVDGCTDEPFEMFSFMIIDIDLPDEASVNIEMQDESARHENSFPGTIITKEVYPEAGPDDVGKVLPMPFGTVSQLTALSLDSGRMTSIPIAISATAITWRVSSTEGLLPGKRMKIDDEIVEIISISGDNLTVTRGVLATIAQTHQRGAMVCEVKDNFIYAVASYPVTSMPKAYGRVGQAIMDISEICTVWPAGDHPDYPGLAVVSVPGYISLTQAIEMLVNDGIDLVDVLAITNTLDITDTITINDLIGINETIAVSPPSIINAAHTHTGGTSVTQAATNCPVGPVSYTASGQYISVTFPALAGTRSAVTYSVTIHRINIPALNAAGITIKVGDVTYISNLAELQNTANGSSITFTFSVNSAQFSSNQIDINIDQSSYSNDGISDWTISSASRSISYDATGGSTTPANTVSGAVKTGTVAKVNSVTKLGTTTLGGDITRSSTNVLKTGTVSISGNSVANTLIGDAILVDVVSPITTPPDVITKVLGTPCNLIGTFPAGYSFNGAITSSKRAPEWCHELARQCRSYFKWVLGQPTLIVRPDTLAPVKSINEIRLNNGMMSHG
ncbi:MAG: hypothetical protein PHH91_14500, partial [Desulfuromonadaceae bacterium]|nr:hypothetical protein [Desulfuromonadaceae bacterium]